MTRERLLALLNIFDERERQESLKAGGKFQFTCADSGISHAERLAVLAEEFGEVSREVAEAVGSGLKVNGAALRIELIQVAAVCVAWGEFLSKDGVE